MNRASSTLEPALTKHQIPGTVCINCELFKRGLDTVSQASDTLHSWRERLQLSPPQSYRAGAELFSSGQLARDVFLLTRGIVGLYYTLDADRQILSTLSYAGHLVDACSFDQLDPTPVSAVALTPCQAYQLSVEKLREAQSRDPRITSLYQHDLNAQLARRTKALAQSLALPPVERLELCLWELAQFIGGTICGTTLRMDIPLKDEHLAMLLGVSPRQLTRLKKVLEERGTMRFEAGHTIVFPDCSAQFPDLFSTCFHSLTSSL